jgi:hypothetical protein
MLCCTFGRKSTKTLSASEVGLKLLRSLPGECAPPPTQGRRSPWTFSTQFLHALCSTLPNQLMY